ncbi:hypothetical protein PACTADRAFT_48753 [Pachysolen tannophilus NRRL Y-2460]|uniref:Small ribosomal subunit protein uS10m n=1 Tax=Pachysolen tannophilus NRRL Y-2460 TaxID=669874 RepID=A0A1E4TZ62_PACTA|nr:hypothetical protein PACTADRAFT_48753 [Pachysolen tannophilus NRRL Y-2460]
MFQVRGLPVMSMNSTRSKRISLNLNSCWFSSSSLCLNNTNIEKEKKHKNDLANNLTARLLKNDGYNPMQLSDEKIVSDINKPLTINVEANYYAPLKNEVKYGDLKCEVTMRAFDSRNLEFFSDFALRAGYYLGLAITGPKPLPVRRERWTVIRSPFVHAKSKENFERRTHARLLRVWDSNPETIDLWLQYLNKHSVRGVGLKAHMYVQEEIDYSKKMDSFDAIQDENINSPNISHFSNTSNPMVADRVKELLNEPHFKRHFNKDPVENGNENTQKTMEEKIEPVVEDKKVETKQEAKSVAEPAEKVKDNQEHQDAKDAKDAKHSKDAKDPTNDN